jgi:hypothetical protein
VSTSKISRSSIPAREEIVISPDDPFLYLSVLAYPGRRDQKKRNEFMKGARAYYAKHAVADAKKRSPNKKLTIPVALRRMKNEKIEGLINKGLRRIRERRNGAFWMAMAVMQGRAPNIEQAAGLWESLLAKHGLRKKGGSFERTSANVKHRVWAASKPVLHLMCAVPLEWQRIVAKRLIYRGAGLPTPPDPDLLDARRADGAVDPLELHHLLLWHEWVPEALVVAELYRTRILPILFPSLDPAQMIRLVPKKSKN